MTPKGPDKRSVNYRSSHNKRPAGAPQRSPAQPSDISLRKRSSTDEIMKASYNQYLKKQHTKKKLIRIALIVLMTVVFTGVLVFAGIKCTNKHKDEEPAAKTQASAETSSQTSVKASEPSEEESKEEQPLINEHTYTINKDRFSVKTVSELDENISAEFVALYDVTADEVVFSKNYSKKCYPASTTKLLTAITACRVVTDPKTVFTVGNEIKMIGEDSSIACLEEGMQLTFEMMIDALLLPSGNDAAYTIAVNCGRIYKNDKKLSNEQAVKAFMELVNKTAAEIGASHTHFVTPDGWHDDNHYTSAQDLMIIGDYARSIDLIRKSCAKPAAEWKLVKGGTLAWQNSNKLIQWGAEGYSKYCDGMKTGFTDQAGTSVVASATMEGHTFIAVVMNAQTLATKYEDCNMLFEKAFKLYDLKYTTGIE